MARGAAGVRGILILCAVCLAVTVTVIVVAVWLGSREDQF